MDTIQRLNFKNYIKAIQDEEIHDFIYDKDNVITVQAKNNEFRVVVNSVCLEFQKGSLFDDIVYIIDKYIVKYKQKERIREILGDDNKVNEEFLKQCREETDGIFKNESTYDYKKNLENLRSNLITEIVNCKISFDEQKCTDEYLDGRIEAYEEILRCIDKVIENKEIKEDV